jgi:phage gp36-like protein
MPFLEANDIETHLYGEVVYEINRSDSNLLQQAINAAVAEAKGYLTAYHLPTIFSATEDDRNPILLLYIKDIAVWHFIQLANPAVDMELRRERYEYAVKWFEKVQSGRTNPDLPLPPDLVDAAGNIASVENFLKWGSNIKRNNHY